MHARKLFALGLLAGASATNLVLIASGFEPIPDGALGLPFPLICFVAGISVSGMVRHTIEEPVTR